MAENEQDLLDLIMSADDYDEFDADLERELLDDVDEDKHNTDKDSNIHGNDKTETSNNIDKDDVISKDSKKSTKQRNFNNHRKKALKRQQRPNSFIIAKNELIRNPRTQAFPSNAMDYNLRYFNDGPPMFNGQPHMPAPSQMFPQNGAFPSFLHHHPHDPFSNPMMNFQPHMIQSSPMVP